MSSPGHFVSNAAGRRDGASWLHQQLKRETAGLHQRLEAKLGFFEPEFSIHRYVQVLQIFHGFYAPVEASLLRLTAVAPRSAFRCVRAPS
jgi:heme oxygenase